MKYNVNNNNLYKVLLNIKEHIENKKMYIEKLLQIDYKYCNFKVNINIFNHIIKKFQNEKINTNKQQKIIIHYNGNPYLTLNLSILSILTNTTIFLEFDECMLGINRFILETVNNVLQDFQTDSLIFINKRNEEIIENVDKIICIDDINKYNTYLCKKIQNVEFYTYNYMDFYTDSDEFEELTELIYNYAENNFISIESYSEFNLDEALKIMQKGLGREIILLTNNEDTKKKFKDKFNNKKIYINENPFEKRLEIINSELFYK